MRNIIIAFFFILFEIILVSSQAPPPPEEQHEIKGTYTTVSVPPNLGAWAICSTELTTTISFSVRIADPSSPVQNFGDTYNYKGDLQTPFTGKTGSGFFISVTDPSFQSDITALGCGKWGEEISTGCDRDTATKEIYKADNWCLFLANPFVNEQKADVAVAFTGSVFKVPFTTPNTPNIVVGGDNGNGTLPAITTTGFNFIKAPSSKRKRNFKRSALKNKY